MKVTINGGQNIIQNLTDGFSNALIINRPLAVNWPDSAGSVGEYYAVSDFSSAEREQLTSSLDAVLINGEKDKLYTNIASFLELFSNGEYNIALTAINQENSNFHYDEAMQWSDQISENERFTYAFYPFKAYDYFFTRPFKSINQERVEYYKQLIESGLRPKIIIYVHHYTNNHYYVRSYSSGPGYVIDGHHKLLAYMELNINIEAVFISKEIKGSNDYVEDLLPLIYPVLKPVEFNHVIYNNPKIYLGNSELSILANTAIDEHLENAKHNVSSEINMILIDASKIKDKVYEDWLVQRINSLKRNQNIGKGLYLYTKGYSEKYKCEAWNSFPINSNSDIKRWIGIVSRQID